MSGSIDRKYIEERINKEKLAENTLTIACNRAKEPFPVYDLGSLWNGLELWAEKIGKII